MTFFADAWNWFNLLLLYFLSPCIWFIDLFYIVRFAGVREVMHLTGWRQLPMGGKHFGFCCRLPPPTGPPPTGGWEFWGGSCPNQGRSNHWADPQILNSLLESLHLIGSGKSLWPGHLFLLTLLMLWNPALIFPMGNRQCCVNSSMLCVGPLLEIADRLTGSETSVLGSHHSSCGPLDVIWHGGPQIAYFCSWPNLTPLLLRRIKRWC